MQTTVLPLKNGEKLHIEWFAPRQAPSAALAQELRTFASQVLGDITTPSGLAESVYLARCLAGQFIDTGIDLFLIGRLDGQIVGDVGCQVAAVTGEVGSLGWVFTDPSQRGKGISSALTALALDWFRAQGGVCMHLGTANPTAHAVYARQGFHAYHGNVMRYLCPGQEPAGFEMTFLANQSPATVRRATWGDASRVAMLYTLPHSWFIKDYGERIFSHPTLPPKRYFSVFTSLMLRAEQQQGAVYVLENASQRVVGAANLQPIDRTVQSHIGVLDFLVYPTYTAGAQALLQRALTDAAALDIQTVRIPLAACDQEKQAIVQTLGFRRQIVLPAQFKLPTETVDLELWQL